MLVHDHLGDVGEGAVDRPLQPVPCLVAPLLPVVTHHDGNVEGVGRREGRCQQVDDDDQQDAGLDLKTKNKIKPKFPKNSNKETSRMLN